MRYGTSFYKQDGAVFGLLPHGNIGRIKVNLFANVPMWEHTRYGEFSLVQRWQRAYFVMHARSKY